MAKKQVFGEEARQQKGTHRKMAKVIISTKTGREKFTFREAIVDQDSVQDYIKEKTS